MKAQYVKSGAKIDLGDALFFRKVRASDLVDAFRSTPPPSSRWAAGWSSCVKMEPFWIGATFCS